MSTTPAFDIESMTLGELSQVEELSGQSISSFSDENAPKARMFTALAYLMKKRQEPTFTFNQAEAMSMKDVMALMGDDDAADPAAVEAQAALGE